jgi:hypothetical protein
VAIELDASVVQCSLRSPGGDADRIREIGRRCALAKAVVAPADDCAICAKRDGMRIAGRNRDRVVER